MTEKDDWRSQEADEKLEKAYYESRRPMGYLEEELAFIWIVFFWI